MRDAQTEYFKIPPHSDAAEQSVLGGVLLDRHAWDRISEKLTEEDFYRKESRVIFCAMRHLAEHSQPVDIVTLKNHLQVGGNLTEAGDEIYLYELLRNTPTAANIVAYAEIVRDRSILRRLISAAALIAERSFQSDGTEAGIVLEEAEGLILAISEKRGSNLVFARDIISEVIGDIAERKDRPGGVTGLATGFIDIDKKLYGLQNGELIVIAGRPSSGKTMCSVNIAEYAAIKNGKSVVIFSLEMSAKQILERTISSISSINSENIKRGDLTDERWNRISHFLPDFKSAKLMIDDSAERSVSDIRSACRRIKRESGLDLVVIDYIQLLSGKAENETIRIGNITRGLKALARELNVPVIAISQLNRELEKRQDKRPMMSDLRSSGGIEQDADVIMFIYRDEVYNKDDFNNKGVAEIIIAKNREGGIGTINLAFNADYCRFDNYTGNYSAVYTKQAPNLASRQFNDKI